MTLTEARAAIRASSGHDADTQVTDAQIDTKLDQEFRRLRRELSMIIPSLYETESLPVIASGANTFAKPADFERLVRLERQISGTNYYVIDLADRLNANQAIDGIVFYERPTTFVVMPESRAPGNYRLTYITAPSAAYTSLDVPAGTEDVIIERCAGWVRMRHDDDPTPHLQWAAQVWSEHRRQLLQRYGAHPVPGFVTRRSGRIWR